MPKYAGVAPKAPGDLALFLLYFAAVLYVLLRAAAWALRVALGVFCCVCCCGCCCRRRKADAKAPAKGKKGGAVEKGKAAAATAEKGKDAAAKSGKKAGKKA
mmetsp:Transcript_21050/g.65128  ORF Transcript_21050/g.65128 Transcript_21050/m.65128 type:complete len:102 (+) Transcript_21050:977-1282(+)